MKKILFLALTLTFVIFALTGCRASGNISADKRNTSDGYVDGNGSEDGVIDDTRDMLGGNNGGNSGLDNGSGNSGNNGNTGNSGNSGTGSGSDSGTGSGTGGGVGGGAGSSSGGSGSAGGTGAGA